MTQRSMTVRGPVVAMVLAAYVVISGCAGTGGDVVDARMQPTSDTSGNESDSRARARIHTELAAGYFDLGNMGVALEEVTVAQQADPNYPPIYNVAALIYAALKDDRRAEDNFQSRIAFESRRCRYQQQLRQLPVPAQARGRGHQASADCSAESAVPDTRSGRW